MQKQNFLKFFFFSKEIIVLQNSIRNWVSTTEYRWKVSGWKFSCSIKYFLTVILLICKPFLVEHVLKFLRGARFFNSVAMGTAYSTRAILQWIRRHCQNCNFLEILDKAYITVRCCVMNGSVNYMARQLTLFLKN